MTHRPPTERIDSSKEKLEYAARHYDQRFCRFHTLAGTKMHGIIHRTYPARFRDAIVCEITADNGSCHRIDTISVEVY